MRKVQDLPVLLAAATAIKARRTEINISQEELAHRADVHRSFVARLELAETQPSLAVFFRLANALEVEVVELKGDHFTALDPALAKFLARVRSDAPQP